MVTKTLLLLAIKYFELNKMTLREFRQTYYYQGKHKPIFNNNNSVTNWCEELI